MQTNEIDVNHIIVRDPKKYDGMYVCKVNYHADSNTNAKMSKFVVCFNDVQVLKVQVLSKHSLTLYLRVGSKDINTILQIEDELVRQTQASSREWFPKKVRSEFLEESFQSTVHVHKSFGTVLKLKIDVPLHKDVRQLNDSSLYNLRVRLHSLKFIKQLYTIVWDLENWETTTSSRNLKLKNDEDDDGHDSEDIAIPSSQDIDDIKVNLMHKLEDRMERIEASHKEIIQDLHNELQNYEARVDYLVNVRNKLEKATTIKELDDLFNMLDEYDE